MMKMIAVVALLLMVASVYATVTTKSIVSDDKYTSRTFSLAGAGSVQVDSLGTLNYVINLNDYNHFTNVPVWYKLSGTQTDAAKLSVKLIFQGAPKKVTNLYRTFGTVDSQAMKVCTTATGVVDTLPLAGHVSNYMRIQVVPYTTNPSACYLKLYFGVPKKGL